MEDGGVAETGRLDSQVAQQVSVGLGTEGNGHADGGKSRSETGAGESGAKVAGTVVKKKRGRPKTYGVDGGAMWSSSSSSRNIAPEVSVKRRRGRPRGSSSRFASVDARPTGGLGGSFSPQTVTLQRGEEIISKLSSLIPPDSRSLAVLSAAGSLSCVIVSQPGPSGGISSYEGCFEILALNGSFSIWEGRICTDPALSLVRIMLARPDGQIFGGEVAGPLTAAGPTQLVVATFEHNVRNELMRVESTKSYASAAIGVSANPIHEVRQPSGTPTSLLPKPTDKEAKTTITSVNNDVNPASLRIDEHNPLEPVEPMLDPNMSTDTKANVPEL